MKNRKSGRRGRASCGNHHKPVFWSLGGPCDKNEAYTSLVRPFLKKLWAREVGLFFGRISGNDHEENRHVTQPTMLLNRSLEQHFEF